MTNLCVFEVFLTPQCNLLSPDVENQMLGDFNSGIFLQIVLFNSNSFLLSICRKNSQLQSPHITGFHDFGHQQTDGSSEAREVLHRDWSSEW